MDELQENEFESKVENDHRKVKILNYFKRIPGFEVVRTSVAPHCGIMYIFFKAEGTTLKEAVRLSNMTHSHIGVGIMDDEVVYQLAVSSSIDYALGQLKNHFDPKKYQCPVCLGVWSEGELKIDSKCPKCDWQIDHEQDEVVDE